MREIYISTDIESDGPIPGEYSMLSFGSAAYLEDKTLISTFSRNLNLLPNAKQDPDTMAWWYQERNRDAWNAHRKNTFNPSTAMHEYVKWIKGLSGNPVFVAYPAGFDFTFIYWYLMKFVGESPFSFSAIDIKTYAMSLLDLPYRQCTKKNMPKSWFDPSVTHDHIAINDAIEQGALFCNMLAYRKDLMKGAK